MKIIWNIAARRKLQEVIDYISMDSPAAAMKYAQEIYSRTNKLLEFPDAGMVFHASGHRVVRKIVIGKTKSIFYRVQKSKIFILAIHDNRQFVRK